MGQLRRAMRAATLIGFEVGVIVVLHTVGAADWLQIPWHRAGEWLQQTPVEESLPALVRIVALALTYWLAISTLLYGLVRIGRIPITINAIEWATLPAVRRFVDGVAAVTVVAATAAGPAVPAVAAEQPSPIVIEVGGDDLPIPPFVGDEEPQRAESRPHGVARIGWTPTPAGWTPLPATPHTPGPVAAAPTHRTVAPGDNLWTIAERHLATFTTTGPEMPSVGDYWLRVVDANRDVISSGDPDLIFPGEVVVLPAVTAEPS